MASQVTEVFPRELFAAVNRYAERGGWNRSDALDSDWLQRRPDETIATANGTVANPAWLSWRDSHDVFPRRYDAAGVAIDDYGWFQSERHYIESRDYGELRGGSSGRDTMGRADREKLFRQYSKGDWDW